MLTYECVICRDRLGAAAIRTPKNLMCIACENNFQDTYFYSEQECEQQEQILIDAWADWNSLLKYEPQARPFNAHKHG